MTKCKWRQEVLFNAVVTFEIKSFQNYFRLIATREYFPTRLVLPK